MTSDTALDSIDEPKPIKPPSTTGMTTKVVKGSLWTLAGQVAPFAISFFATRYVIRFLGSESYGVLLLIGLIPTYFVFADFGMGIASTKFASEAHGQGDHTKERDVVWTAVAIAAVSSMIIAVPMFLFSAWIVAAFNVPEHLVNDASTGLKITAVAFVIGIFASVLNSPMLARLRMDLNTATTAVPKILLVTVTPFILYFGGGIVGAVWWTFIVAVMAFLAVFYFSAWLLPALTSPRFDRALVKPLLKFGGAWLIASVGSMLLVNSEKLLLTRLVSVTALAYYSIAFTFANLAMMFSLSLLQTLIPAFSQLQAPERRSEFDGLFSRANRLIIIFLFPAAGFMSVIAKPFFGLWLGAEFGVESSVPFYILIGGVCCVLLASVANTTIVAAGRTGEFAKLYWIELVVYIAFATVFIYFFGIVGAAAAWSIRAIFDAYFIVRISKKVAAIKYKYFEHLTVLVAGSLLSIVPIALHFLLDRDLVIAATLYTVGTAAYFWYCWNKLVTSDERTWLLNRIQALRS